MRQLTWPHKLLIFAVIDKIYALGRTWVRRRYFCLSFRWRRWLTAYAFTILKLPIYSRLFISHVYINIVGAIARPNGSLSKSAHGMIIKSYTIWCHIKPWAMGSNLFLPASYLIYFDIIFRQMMHGLPRRWHVSALYCGLAQLSLHCIEGWHTCRPEYFCISRRHRVAPVDWANEKHFYKIGLRYYIAVNSSLYRKIFTHARLDGRGIH